ncbi:hypothetical protein JOF56_006949 [Kibdelosporangium banguiense]|uniref:CHAT domain-containing protein n=1 Tax=Kibdelosporangium banguiense TaxID=1365924 RepID=A0ABS4TQ83_9PSEU|nr:CHAT domain-containing protein [Kibdelosporangium banguiense]MBP2326564.1 hypothetical protein [Kibdelosporangium banguiense]
MTVDLELGLVWDADQSDFEVNLRLSGANGLDDVDFLSHAISIDADELRELHYDERQYGARLSDMVFARQKIKDYYHNAVRSAQDQNVHFRLHLSGPPRFHQLRWESLRAPGDNATPIATTGKFLFSRYLSGENWPLIPSRRQRDRRALIAVAAPSDVVDGWQRAPVDRKAEIERARAALANYRVEELQVASLQQIASRLDKERFEVLYLVAHGWLTDDVPRLLLEKADGTGDMVDARRLAERVHALDNKPTLAMLVSCQSANAGESSDSGALAGLGPRLSGAGIPAVVAMQGNITMTTAQTFVTEFFDAFRDDPFVDRAMTKARLAVRDRRDWWAPVLFSRLRSGRAYHVTTFPEDAGDLWDNLSLALTGKMVTPVLGPGLAERIVGSRSEIARRWALRWQMPIVWHGRSNLAQVAQYLRVTKDPDMVPLYLKQFLMSDLRERVETPPHQAFRGLPARLLEEADPVEVILEVGRRMRQDDPDDPFRVAAGLPVPIFVTTGWTNLLQDALQEQGKRPLTICYPWHREKTWQDIAGARQTAAPTVSEPWVCHLFGRLDDPRSLVLTEDDYFAWLTAWVGKRSQLPPSLSYLKTALSVRKLLFVGYQLREWDFQVLFQGIQTFEGRDRRIKNVGVQLMPDVDVIEPEAAQRYLECALADVKIFWSDTTTFMAELRKQMESRR